MIRRSFWGQLKGYHRASALQSQIRRSRLESHAAAQSCRPSKLCLAARCIHTRSETGDDVLEALEGRGLINQIVGERGDLQKLLDNDQKVGVYIGVDPTAPSMHLGNLVPMMALYWLYALGCHAFCLTGGATAIIGDPSGRTAAREKQASSTRQGNAVRISTQLQKLFENLDHSIERHIPDRQLMGKKTMLDNISWFEKTQALDMLGTLAAGMKMGPLLGRDSVKMRMSKGDSMSLAEFLYPMLQAWDWWHLYKHHNVRLQIGGSDQFGNILAGADGVNYMRKHHRPPLPSSAPDASPAPIGFTVPLLTTSSGEKFGKSAGNAIWLDPNMTSPFQFYQFFLRTPDTDVQRYLQLFTFLPLPTITDIMAHHNEDPPQRLAQHTLAQEVTALVHGPETADSAAQEHRRLFQHSSSQQQGGDITASLNPVASLPVSQLKDMPVSKLLHQTGLAPSRQMARTMVKARGVYAGQIKDGKLAFHPIGVSPEDTTQGAAAREVPVDWETLVVEEGKKLILRRGKTDVQVIRIVSNEQ